MSRIREQGVYGTMEQGVIPPPGEPPLEDERQDSSKGDEIAAVPEPEKTASSQSPQKADPSQSQAKAEQSQSQAEAEQPQSQAEAEQSQSQAKAEPSQSQAKAEPSQPPARAEQTQSPEEAEGASSSQEADQDRASEAADRATPAMGDARDQNSDRVEPAVLDDEVLDALAEEKESRKSSATDGPTDEEIENRARNTNAALTENGDVRLAADEAGDSDSAGQSDDSVASNGDGATEEAEVDESKRDE